ncbi:diacylglycerol/lipid kinase family protein [Microbacterium sp.]|uniref:diacylglycerol/lipid kinase family protein n=1 Tax=Microbacterium sp. TaxID=51671 RepID=UPI002E36DC1C|nr:diacylglycerol kinase family protein [Microbacterium sp.]HEX5729468.1 diacylglycerol kinase family protein [Microbacterium sp.]
METMNDPSPSQKQSSSQRRAALIYNPVKLEVDDLRPQVEAAENEAGWGPTLWLETTEEDPGTGQAKEALESGATVVIAAGGDGTVRAIAEVMRGSGIPMALLPSGTGNLLARNLDLTLDDPENSLATAFAGQDRAIDMALIDIRNDQGTTRYAYLVMAGLGLDAKMLANTDDDLKAKAGWLAYVQAIAKALGDKNRLRLRYSLDGSRARSLRAHTVMVGNCGSLPANILLLPEASVDDGIFDIVVLRPEGFFGWVQIATKIVWENGVLRRTSAGRKLMGATKEVRALNYLKGKEFVARLSRAEQIQLDGDSFGEALAFKTWVDPSSLLIRVPAA